MLVFVLLTSACGDKDEPPTPSNPLVGTWTEIHVSQMPFTLVLNSDNTGTISYDTSSRALMTDRFNWSVQESSNGTSYMNIVHTGGDLIIHSVVNQYVLAGNSLILLFDFTGDGNYYQADFVKG